MEGMVACAAPGLTAHSDSSTETSTVGIIHNAHCLPSPHREPGSVHHTAHLKDHVRQHQQRVEEEHDDRSFLKLYLLPPRSVVL